MKHLIQYLLQTYSDLNGFGLRTFLHTRLARHNKIKDKLQKRMLKILQIIVGNPAFSLNESPKISSVLNLNPFSYVE